MVDILHRIAATTTPDRVYEALTTIDGLAGWWTTDTTGDAAPGGTITFRFGPPRSIEVEVMDQRPYERVTWEVTDGPEEWIGTHVTFELEQEGPFTIVRFKHEHWREPVEFMSHCSTRWATYLLSLKALVETGAGSPHPDEISIGNWQ